MNDLASGLTEVARIDPFALEPGALVGERFCVVGAVSHSERGWTVPVTDLERAYGSAPNHRVLIQHVVLPRSARAAWRRAAGVEGAQPRVYGMVETEAGVELVMQDHGQQRPRRPLDTEAFASVALALSHTLAGLHQRSVEGVHFTLDALRLVDGRVTLSGLGHLTLDGDAAADVARLIRFLSELDAEAAAALLPSPIATAAELAYRVQTLHAHERGQWHGPLPVEPPFVGRADELAALQAAYRDALIARPSVWLACGERGVGKSRLLHEYGEWLATNTDALVVRSEFVASPNRRNRGLAAVLLGLVEIIDRVEPRRAAEIHARLARAMDDPGVLGKHLPQLAGLFDAPEPAEFELEDEFLRYAETVAAALGGVGSGTQPLVVLLENGEHADASARAILRLVAQLPQGHHVQVVTAVRGDPPTRLLDAGARCLHLEPLEEEPLHELLGETFSGGLARAEDVVARLYAASGGYPLAAWASLQLWVREEALTADGDGRWHFDGDRTANAKISALFTHRIGRLTENGRSAALVAAVRDGTVDSGWLAAVMEESAGPASQLIDELLRSGLFVSVAGSQIRFWHDEARATVLEAASDDEIRRAHARVASWLRGRPKVDAAQLAYHAESAQEHGEGLAELHAEAATELLRVYETEAALWHLERALAHGLSGRPRLSAMEAAGDASVLGGHPDAAVDWYLQTITEAETDLDAVTLGAKGLRALYATGASEPGIRLGRAVLARVGQPLPESPPGKVAGLLGTVLRLGRPVGGMDDEVKSGLCRVYAWLTACLIVGDPAAMVLCMLRSYRLSHGLETGNAALAIAFYGGNLRGNLGHYDAATRLLDRAEVLAEATADHWALGSVHHLRAQTVTMPSGSYDAGQALFDRAIEEFRLTGDLSIAGLSMYFKVAYGRDREPAAKLLSWLDTAEAMARRHGNEVSRLQLSALRLWIEASCGAPDIGERAAELAARVDEGGGITHDRLAACIYLAGALLEAGQLDLAKRRISEAVGMVSELPGLPEVLQDVYVVQSKVLLAQPTLSRTDRRQLRRAMKRLRAAGRKSPRLASAHQLALARLARRDGKVDRACRLAEGLLRMAELQGSTLMMGRAHAELSRLLSGRDVLAAAEHARHARALIGQLGGSMASLPSPRDVAATAALPEPVEAPAPPTLRALLDDADFGRIVRNVLAQTKEALAGLEVQASADEAIEAECSVSALESILVNLLLTGRDALPDATRMLVSASRELVGQARAAELPGAAAGAYTVLRVLVPSSSPITRTFAGLSGCRQAVSRVGGFLTVEQNGRLGLVIAAYLPSSRPADPRAAPVSRGRVAVIHADERIRRTLVGSLASLGYDCLDAATPDGLGDYDASIAVFADADSAGAVVRPDAHVVEVVARGAEATMNLPVLHVPFAVEDLEKVMDAGAARQSKAD